MRKLICLAASVLFASACATQPPIDAAGVESSLSPQEVAGSAAPFTGTDVLWGGVVVASRNLAEHTQLEILGYPLGSDQRPDTDRKPQGRFLLEQPGYIETANYAPGRTITARGEIVGEREGRIGEARYTYPVLRVEQLHLWSEQQRSSVRPRFNLGVGVIFGR